MNLHTTPELARLHREDLLAAAAEERLARQVRRPAVGRLVARLRRTPAPVAPVTPVTPATPARTAGRTASAA